MRKIINYFIKLIILSSFLMGLFLVGYAGKDIYEIKISEDKATKEAIELIEQSVEKRKSNKPFLKKDFSPNFGSSTGILQIDKIDANLPIVEGTYTEEGLGIDIYGNPGGFQEKLYEGEIESPVLNIEGIEMVFEDKDGDFYIDPKVIGSK